MAVTGAVAQTTYKVSVKEGTEDASNWQGKAGEGEYQALPLEGVAAGTAVSVKYNGTKKVKSVKAKKKAAAYTMAANATAGDVGKLICTDGHIHTYSADAACTKSRVAKIIYVGSSTGDATYNHGLALALTDEGSSGMAWEAAKTACTSKNTSAPVSSASWMLPSTAQWNTMFSAAGSYTSLRDGFTSVGGSNLESDWYWSSTENGSDSAWLYYFDDGHLYDDDKECDENQVRACLAF